MPSTPYTPPIYGSDALPTLRKFVPGHMRQQSPREGVFSVTDLLEYMTYVKENPLTQLALMDEYRKVSFLFGPNPALDPMLAPGFADQIISGGQFMTGEAMMDTPSFDPAPVFADVGMTSSHWQATHSRITAGAMFKHLDLMRTQHQLSRAGIPTIAEMVMKGIAETVAREASRMSITMLYSVLYDNWNLHPTSPFHRDLIVDISSSNPNDKKFVVILFGQAPPVFYRSVPSQAIDNAGVDSMNIQTEWNTHMGSGSTRIWNRHRFYVHPNGFSWVGRRGGQRDVFLKRMELLNIEQNWERQVELDRRDIPWGAIICNAIPTATTSANNYPSAVRVMEIMQHFWGDTQDKITHIVMPSTLTTHLAIAATALNYPTSSEVYAQPTKFANLNVVRTDQLPLWNPTLPLTQFFDSLFPSTKADIRKSVASNFIHLDGITYGETPQPETGLPIL